MNSHVLLRIQFFSFHNLMCLSKKLFIFLLVVVVISLMWCKSPIQESFTLEHNFKTYVINLDVSKDRLETMSKQCKKEHIEFERFPGVNGKILDPNKMDNVKNKKLQKGAIGCHLSHVGVWKKALKQPEQTILVLEDDVIFPDDFKNQLNFYLQKVPKDFDILYLGGSNLKLKKYNNLFGKPIKTPPKKTYNTGCYAMVIRKKCLQLLVNECEIVNDHIDQIIKNKLFDQLNIYYVIPPLIQHDNKIASMRRLNSGKKPTSRWFKDTQNKIKII